jgi:hypothetical protein
MELDQALFEQIVTGLGAARNDQRPAPDADKRGAGRIAISAEVVVEAFGTAKAQPRTVQLRSLSRGGAAILDWGTIQTGDKVVLHLPKPDGSDVPVVCIVKNSRVSGGEFRLGMQFLSRAEQTASPMVRAANGLVTRPENEGAVDILDAIADGVAVPTKGADGREKRVEINVRAMMSTYFEGQCGPMYSVMVKDVSAGGGVCILHPEEMARDEQFVLQIPRKMGKPLTMICTVVDCRPLDDFFRVGARFVTRLGADLDGSQRVGLLGRIKRWLAA